MKGLFCKVLAVILVMLGLLSTFSIGIFAMESAEDTPKVLQVDSTNEIVDEHGALDEMDLIILPDDKIESTDKAVVKEFLDNGTDLLLTGENGEMIAEILECDYSASDEDGAIIGAYVRNAMGSYSITPITVVALYEEEEEPTELQMTADLTQLKEYASDSALDADGIYADLSKSNPINLTDLSQDELAKLQIATELANAFVNKHWFAYFWKKGTVDTIGTTYKVSGEETMSGWTKMGSMSILGYAIKIQTSGTETYDNVHAVTNASGLGGSWVTDYTFNMKTNNQAIIHTSILPSNKITDQQIGVTSGVSGGNPTSTTTYTYKYNPEGQTITNTVGNQYCKTWRAQPGKVVNGTFQLKPNMAVKSTTTTQCIIDMNFSYFQVKKGIRTFTIGATVGTSFKFKNHAAA